MSAWLPPQAGAGLGWRMACGAAPRSPVSRVRQNGAHRARRARKVSVFDGKFYLSFLLLDEFSELFDGYKN